MKTKSIVVTSIILLLAIPASAKPGNTREVTVDYQGANTYEDDNGFMTVVSSVAKPQSGERFVTVVIADAAGQPVLAEVHQGQKDLTGDFCGETGEAVMLDGRGRLHVHLYAGPGCDGVSLPTQGTITFSFHR